MECWMLRICLLMCSWTSVGYWGFWKKCYDGKVIRWLPVVLRILLRYCSNHHWFERSYGSNETTHSYITNCDVDKRHDFFWIQCRHFFHNFVIWYCWAWEENLLLLLCCSYLHKDQGGTATQKSTLCVIWIASLGK